MNFEKWWEEETFIASPKEIARAAWQAATLAERERAAKVAETIELEGSFILVGRAVGELVAATIRKGEGV